MNVKGKPGQFLDAPGLQENARREIAAEAHRQQQRRFLSLAEVESIVRLKKSSIYRMAAEGTFPNAIRVSARCVAWDSVAIDRWMQARIDAAGQLHDCVSAGARP